MSVFRGGEEGVAREFSERYTVVVRLFCVCFCMLWELVDGLCDRQRWRCDAAVSSSRSCLSRAWALAGETAAKVMFVVWLLDRQHVFI